jgi:hypothetical protein
MSLYLKCIHTEAESRGYTFDKSKIKPARKQVTLSVTSGQMQYEWSHLMGKLKVRNPALYQKWRGMAVIEPHPLFSVRAGEIESWERQ